MKGFHKVILYIPIVVASTYDNSSVSGDFSTLGTSAVSLHLLQSEFHGQTQRYTPHN